MAKRGKGGLQLLTVRNRTAELASGNSIYRANSRDNSIYPPKLRSLMMKDFAIEYSPSWQDSPMAYWVHIEQDSQLWLDSEAYNPPAPKRDVSGLYKIYKVTIEGFTFKFSSLEQLEHCIEILSMKSLPTTMALSEKRSGSEGPNSHWLSSFPAQVKSWRYRQKAVKYLSKVKEELKNNL